MSNNLPYRIQRSKGDVYYLTAQIMLYDYHYGTRKFEGNLQMFRHGVGWVRYDEWS